MAPMVAGVIVTALALSKFGAESAVNARSIPDRLKNQAHKEFRLNAPVKTSAYGDAG